MKVPSSSYVSCVSYNVVQKESADLAQMVGGGGGVDLKMAAGSRDRNMDGWLFSVEYWYTVRSK